MPGTSIPWPPFLKVISVSGMMNMFPMATWDTLCHHLGWLSPLVSYFTQASDGRDLGLVFYQSKWMRPISLQARICRMFLRLPMKKGLFGSTTQQIVINLYLKVLYVQRLHFYIICVHIEDPSEAINKLCVSAEWLAHENAVFDIAWVPREAQLVSMTLYPIPLLIISFNSKHVMFSVICVFLI